MAEPGQIRGKVSCGPIRILVFLLFLLALSLVATPWWLQWREYRETGVQAAARVARYRELLGSREELQAQLAHLREQIRQRGYFVDENNPELAAAQLQKIIKEMVKQAGGTLMSTQHIPAESTERLRRIGIKVRLKGDVVALARVLYALESSNPILSVEDLSIRSRRVIKRRRKNRVEGYGLDANFKVVGYLLGNAP